MVYLWIVGGRAVHHADLGAAAELDGLTRQPDVTITEAEFDAADGILRVVDGGIVLGKTADEKAAEAERGALAAEEAALLKELAEKDYKVVKAAEIGQVLAELDPGLHVRRDWCRARINAIRERLGELPE